MIKTGDQDKKAENLKFLLEAGLIYNPALANKLKTFLSKSAPGSGPTLPASSESIPLKLQESSLAERIKDLPKKADSSPRSATFENFTIQNHILPDRTGSLVTPLETVNRGKTPIKALKIVVIKFTGIDIEQATLTWFTNAQAKASTHLVVNRDGKVAPLVPFGITAWHAGASRWRDLQGLNQYSVGIDLINGGQLQKQNRNWVSFNGKVYPSNEVFEY